MYEIQSAGINAFSSLLNSQSTQGNVDSGGDNDIGKGEEYGEVHDGCEHNARGYGDDDKDEEEEEEEEEEGEVDEDEGWAIKDVVWHGDIVRDCCVNCDILEEEDAIQPKTLKILRHYKRIF